MILVIQNDKKEKMGALQSCIVFQRRKKSKNEENVGYEHAVVVTDLFVTKDSYICSFRFIDGRGPTEENPINPIAATASTEKVSYMDIYVFACCIWKPWWNATVYQGLF